MPPSTELRMLGRTTRVNNRAVLSPSRRALSSSDGGSPASRAATGR